MPPSSRKRNHPDNYDDGDVSDIKVIPFKRRNMNYSQEEEVKTIKIVKDSSPVSERVMCNICGASLMSQAYLDRHMKSSKGSMDRWNFKNLKLMNVKVTR